MRQSFQTEPVYCVIGSLAHASLERACTAPASVGSVESCVERVMALLSARTHEPTVSRALGLPGLWATLLHRGRAGKEWFV